jgi:hypothetical protein
MYGTMELDLQTSEGKTFAATVRGFYFDVRTFLQNAVYVIINLSNGFFFCLTKGFPNMNSFLYVFSQ